MKNRKQADLVGNTYAAAGEDVTFFWFGEYLTATVDALLPAPPVDGVSIVAYLTVDADGTQRIVRPSQIVGHRVVPQDQVE